MADIAPSARWLSPGPPQAVCQGLQPEHAPPRPAPVAARPSRLIPSVPLPPAVPPGWGAAPSPGIAEYRLPPDMPTEGIPTPHVRAQPIVPEPPVWGRGNDALGRAIPQGQRPCITTENHRAARSIEKAHRGGVAARLTVLESSTVAAGACSVRARHRRHQAVVPCGSTRVTVRRQDRHSPRGQVRRLGCGIVVVLGHYNPPVLKVPMARHRTAPPGGPDGNDHVLVLADPPRSDTDGADASLSTGPSDDRRRNHGRAWPCPEVMSHAAPLSNNDTRGRVHCWILIAASGDRAAAQA